jgi:hypothetical protein
MPFSRGPAHAFLKFYVIAGLPIAFLNGYLIRLSWLDCFVVGVERGSACSSRYS